MFPSPFGVICSLIEIYNEGAKYELFPSPFGVICSLIEDKKIEFENIEGFRLLSELYVL